MGRIDEYVPEANQAPSMQHLGHPHPLELCILQNPNTVISCSGCKLQPSGTMYICRPCNFTLDSTCAQLPQLITHPCHPNHVLILLPTSPYPGGRFCCIACNRQGDGFSYNCKLCFIALHVICASKPLRITHQMHPCQLELTFRNSYSSTRRFSCDVCSKKGAKQWLYRCSACEFDVHLDCANASRNRMSMQPQNQFQVPFGADSGIGSAAAVPNVFMENAEMGMIPPIQKFSQPPVDASQVNGSAMPNQFMNSANPMGNYQFPQGNQLMHIASSGPMTNYQPTIGNSPMQSASLEQMPNYQRPIDNQITHSASTGSVLNNQPPIIQNNQASAADGVVNAAFQGLVEFAAQAWTDFGAEYNWGQ